MISKAVLFIRFLSDEGFGEKREEGAFSSCRSFAPLVTNSLTVFWSPAFSFFSCIYP